MTLLEEIQLPLLNNSIIGTMKVCMMLWYWEQMCFALQDIDFQSSVNADPDSFSKQPYSY